MASEEITDLTRGVYRRLYAGFVRGRRICSASLAAEAWFWRLHAAADDFGNLDGDPVLCHAATAGRRADQVSASEVAAMVDELEKLDLLRTYTVGRESLLHIVGFTALQPSGKNGKRLKRFPNSPWDKDESTGCIRVNPSATSASHSQDDSQDHSEDEVPAARGGASSPPAKHAPAQADGVPGIRVFPVRASQSNKSREWPLTQDVLDELKGAFPELDVLRVLDGCLFKLRNGRVPLKTGRGMKTFLWSWMERELRYVKTAAPTNGPRKSGAERQQDIIEEVFSPEHT